MIGSIFEAQSAVANFIVKKLLESEDCRRTCDSLWNHFEAITFIIAFDKIESLIHDPGTDDVERERFQTVVEQCYDTLNNRVLPDRGMAVLGAAPNSTLRLQSNFSHESCNHTDNSGPVIHGSESIIRDCEERSEQVSVVTGDLYLFI